MDNARDQGYVYQNYESDELKYRIRFHVYSQKANPGSKLSGLYHKSEYFKEADIFKKVKTLYADSNCLVGESNFVLHHLQCDHKNQGHQDKILEHVPGSRKF